MMISKSAKRLILLTILAGTLAVWGGCSDDPTAPETADPGQSGPNTEALTKALSIRGPGSGHVEPMPSYRPYNPIDFGDGLVADSEANPQGITTTLTDQDSGDVVAELIWSNADQTVTIDVPGHVAGTCAGPTTLPNFYGTNLTLYYVYKGVLAGAPGKAGEKDEPGCDRIPDWLETTCMRACCAIHDACYAAENPPCTEKSWFGTEGLACTLCNVEVVACMMICKPWYVPDWIITRLWELFTD